MKSFKLEVKGPSGCGKSSFLDLLIEKFFWEDTVRLRQTREHELEVFLKRGAFPSPLQERKEKEE